MESKEEGNREVIKLINIAPGCVRVTDVAKVNFKKLFRDIDLHVDVGLKLYKAQRSESDTVLYGVFTRLREHLDEARINQEKISANMAKLVQITISVLRAYRLTCVG